VFEKNLPILFVKIEGSVSTNIIEFKTEIDAYVGGINKELVTDEHFGRAESDIKFCKKTEHELVRVILSWQYSTRLMNTHKVMNEDGFDTHSG